MLNNLLKSMDKRYEKMENFTSEFQNDKMGILELNIQMKRDL